MNALASIIAYLLPKQIKYIAMLDWMDQMPADSLTVECPEYSLRIVKVKKEEAKAIADFIEKRMVEEVFTIKEPIGILSMKPCDCSPNYCCCSDADREFSAQLKGTPDVAKQVKLVVGEGEDKIEVGIADVEKMPNGDAMVTLSITNSALIKALGGAEVKGIIPKFSEEESSE